MAPKTGPDSNVQCFDVYNPNINPAIVATGGNPIMAGLGLGRNVE